MTKPMRSRLAACLIATTLAACGGDAPPPAAVPAPAAVDPAALEADVEPLPATAPETPAPWEPAIAPVPPARVRAVLRAAAVRASEGRLMAAPQIGQAPAEDQAGPEPGALEMLLGVLATDPAQPEAREAVDRIAVRLQAEGRQALAEGRLADGRAVEPVLQRAAPQHPELPSYREALAAAARADEWVRRGEARARAGRVLAPEGAGAVAAFRQALQAFPGYLPASDGLVRLQAERLHLALGAAQAGDYPASERLQSEAARILPASPALQDMAARIAELRQGRTEQLLVQGHAAVDALDLELAQRRLAEAERTSLQARGLEELAERISLARHYGRFRPGQVFREMLAAGGEGPEMVVLPHGEFTMGSPEEEPRRQDNEGPRHAIRFHRGFAVARNEVAVGDFRRFVEASGYRSVATRRGRSTVYDERGGIMGEHARVDWRRDHAGAPAADGLPVVHVAFEDAEAYAGWLSAQTGQRYRLPSEAEFEYALRAGRDTAYPWGREAPSRVVGNLTGDGDRSATGRRWSNAIAGYADGHWGPAPVRSYPAEPFGTFDLVGNVSEWVQDCWHDSYRRAPGDGSAWVNPGCSERVVRGASWSSTLDRARAASRQSSPADATNGRVGFRVVREL